MADFQSADKANSDKKAVQRKTPVTHIEQKGFETGGLNANQLAVLHMQQSQGNRAVLRMLKASQANRVSRDPKDPADDTYAEFETPKPAAATSDPAAEAAKAAEFDKRGQDALNNLGGA